MSLQGQVLAFGQYIISLVQNLNHYLHFQDGAFNLIIRVLSHNIFYKKKQWSPNGPMVTLSLF